MIKFSDGIAIVCTAVLVTGSLSMLRAQDDLDDLLKELNDTPAKKAVAPAAQPVAPKPAEAAPSAPKPAEAAPAPKPAEPAPVVPAPAPVEVKPAVPAPKPADAKPAVPVPAPAEVKPVAPAPAPVDAKPAVSAPAAQKPDEQSVDDLIKEIDKDAQKPEASAAPAPAPVDAKPAIPAPAPVDAKPAIPAPAATPSNPPSGLEADADEILAKLEKEEAAKLAADKTAKENASVPAPVPAPVVAAPADEPAPSAEPVPAAETDPKPAAAEGVESSNPPALPSEPSAPSAGDSALPEDPVLREIVMLENMRREALEKQAADELAEARKNLAKGNWQMAFDKFGLAERNLDPGRVDEHAECRKGMGQAKFELAKIAKNDGDKELALKLAKEARSFGHPGADDLIDALNENTAFEDRVDRSETQQRLNEPEYKEKRQTIRKNLKSARSYMATAEYDTAMGYVEAVLSADPYNSEAIFLREQIAYRKTAIGKLESEANRVEMISQIERAKRLTYAVDVPGVKTDVGITTKRPVGEDPARLAEEDIEKRMKEIILPNVSFKPPATISDAVDQFRQASRDYDRQDKPMEERGINFILDLGKTITGAGGAAAANAAPADDFAAPAAPAADAGQEGIPQIPNLTASNISLWEALKLVCEVTGFKFKIRGSMVRVMPKNYDDEELITRSYNVMDNFIDRVNQAGADIRQMRSGGNSDFGGNNNNNNSDSDSSGISDARAFFEGMGVQFPPRASIHYIKALGKLRVTNTAENLAVLEQALNDLNVTPMLIEIETRFVEVAQEDLNSLGFEWLLNSDYSLHVGNKIAKALNLKDGNWITTTSSGTSTTTSGTTTSDGTTGLSTGSTTGGTTTGGASDANTTETALVGLWQKQAGTRRQVGISGNNSGMYTTGHRFLTDLDNPISGSGNYTNDKFMKLNAFLGNADLSLILHMLSQRSDTDLLSAPKVTTKSGQQAVIKVVTEYIYPTDYDVTIQGSGGSYSNGKILAMVEPQNFTMREVGVILDVTPEVTAEGQMINLALKPEVISEPEWKNYGMKIPIDNSSSSIIPGYNNGLSGLSADALQTIQQLTQGNTASNEQEYYDAPMEQPFFKRRAIETNLSVYNGATVVMGGLITEERKTMDDKIPFLGDIPYIGRLFRSRSEWSSKRNLLVFVTARLVDPRGREVSMGTGDRNEETKDAKVTPAPAAATPAPLTR